MVHIKNLTRYVANFVDALVKSGLEHVVISPGSRSTPLAMTVCKHEKLQDWTIVDERSAAYFALGMAKQTKKPVALLCTSGTAAANYYPAIIEAYYNRVPLIVLTADRPHELRDVGASQAIDQIKMYGEHVKWFQEMPIPEATEELISFARTTAIRAFQIALEGNAGPIQLNFPFREPLIPDLSLENLWGDPGEDSFHQPYTGTKTVHANEVQKILTRLKGKEKGLLVCGPQEDNQLAGALTNLAEQWQVPLLADPLSQIRGRQRESNYVIENYDALFRSEQIRKKLQPDFIIRFGAMPVSKHYSFYAEEHKMALHILIEPDKGFRQPTKQPTQLIYADPVRFIEQLLQHSDQPKKSAAWLDQWLHMNKIATKHIHDEIMTELTEGTAVKHLLKVIPEESVLYVGNSMPVRDLDTFYVKTDRNLSLGANRGASGIEGLTSSALGVSATTEKKVTLLIGDLSFYHDLNGLLTAKQYNLDLTVLLINNDGGGIFSFLPQVEEGEYFEKLFGTPLGIDFKQVIEMYGGSYQLAQDLPTLERQLLNSYQTHGLHVIEVQTDRGENVKWHQKIWQAIAEDLVEDEQ